MAIDNKVGYVTFADILGWKGIWQRFGKERPVQMLFNVRSGMKSCVDSVIGRYYSHLIQNELASFFELEKRNEVLKKFSKIRSDYEKIIPQYAIDGGKAIQEKLDELKVEMNVELISDTFVITTSSRSLEYETILHAYLAQNLLMMCLKENLLIRGATSYGEYYKEQLVFIGPAIDDAASWHELGEEIGIYFTPKALLIVEKEMLYNNKVKINNISLCDILKKAVPYLKVQPFNTYIVDWSSMGDKFNQVIYCYDTILPNIHKKIIFSRERLQKLISHEE